MVNKKKVKHTLQFDRGLGPIVKSCLVAATVLTINIIHLISNLSIKHMRVFTNLTRAVHMTTVGTYYLSSSI